MAKPVNLYQGSAPAAMAQMGQGISEAGARIGQMMQGGYESMGKGLAKGIDAAAEAYKQNQQEQARFDATKKMYKAFESFIPDNKQKEAIQGIFDDTSMSVAQKNQLAPTLLNFLAQSQQQAGRESVANIMAGSRVQAAEARRPAPNTEATFSVPTLNDVFGLPGDGSQGTPVPFRAPAPAIPQSGQPASRIGPNGQMEVWSSRLGRYVELDNPMQDIQY